MREASTEEKVQSQAFDFESHVMHCGAALWEICRAVVSHCIAYAILPADRYGPFALYFCESLQILAPSHPSPVVAGL